MQTTIQPEFVLQYKNQYYPQAMTKEQLLLEQEQLIDILENLNKRADKCFKLACSRVEKNKTTPGVKETGAGEKENARLPVLVIEAELKNEQSYRQLLAREKKKLESRVQETACLKEQDINAMIRAHKDKLAQMKKTNKREKHEIDKLGDKLVDENKQLQQMYLEMLEEVESKRKDNTLKAERLAGNLQKIDSLKSKSINAQLKITQRQNQSQSQFSLVAEANEKIEEKHNALLASRQIVQNAIKSMNTRMSQQYYNRLKQLESISKNIKQLDIKYDETYVRVKQQTGEIHS